MSAPSAVRTAAVILGATVLGGLILSLTDSLGPIEVTAWPIGVATGVALQFRERGGIVVLSLAGLAMVGTFVLAGESLWLTLMVASAEILGAAMVVVVLTGGVRIRPYLRSDDDVSGYLQAALLGAALVGVYMGTCLAVLDQADPVSVGLAMAAAHLSSQLLYLPFFLPTHARHGEAGRMARVVQWICVAVLTVGPLVVSTTGPILFPLIAALAWGARRLSTWEALGQTLTVCMVLGVSAEHDEGPLARASSFMPWSAHPVPLMVSIFTCCCAVVVVPTVLNAGMQRVLLREASARRDWLERIVDSPRDIAIFGTDGSGAITMFNPGAERLLGYSAEEVMGGSPAIFHRPEDLAALATQLGLDNDYATLAKALAHEDETSRTVRFRRKDGVVRTHLTTLNRVTDIEGDVAGFVVISEDVTDRVREQEALEEALEGLRQLDASKDAFVSSVSHELRTPLTSMMGYLELIRDGAFGDVDAGQLKALDRVSANAERLLGLIEDLLTFSRLGQAPATWAQDEIDLRDVVHTGCEVVRPAWEAAAIDVRTTLSSEPVMVRGDASVLERMVVNLVGNAVKFTGAGGSVDVGVAVERSDDAPPVARLSVRDTGIGIPADEVPRLFERFFRSRLALQGAVQGSGLGLSIVQAAVEVHEGTIAVDSVEGEGTTFTVRLPLTAVVAPVAASPGSAAPVG